jgi:hypothetical protein
VDAQTTTKRRKRLNRRCLPENWWQMKSEWISLYQFRSSNILSCFICLKTKHL